MTTLRSIVSVLLISVGLTMVMDGLVENQGITAPVVMVGIGVLVLPKTR